MFMFWCLYTGVARLVQKGRSATFATASMLVGLGVVNLYGRKHRNYTNMQVPAWFRHAADDRTADGTEFRTFSLAEKTALHTPLLSEGCANVPRSYGC
jgi:hypothetical protein